MSTQSTLIAFCLLQWRLLFLVDQADIRTIWKLDFPIEGIQSLDLDFSVGFRVLLPIYNPDLKVWIHVSQSNVPLETWPSRRATFVMSLVRPGRGSLRKQPTFHDTNTGFPAKWQLRNERRNSILMARHYPDLGLASDWLKQISYAARPIRSTIQIWIVTRHQYGISALVSQTSFGGETSDGVVKCGLLFFHTRKLKTILDCGLDAVDSGFQDWIPDSLMVEKGFRILFIIEIPDSLSCIPESKAQDSGFHKPKFAPFQNPNYLTLATKYRIAL